MGKNIEPIMQVLSNYLQHLVLSEEESHLLRSWLMESGANEDLFDEICNKQNGSKIVRSIFPMTWRDLSPEYACR